MQLPFLRKLTSELERCQQQAPPAFNRACRDGPGVACGGRKFGRVGAAGPLRRLEDLLAEV
jgi:hypothetical protein